MSVKKFSVISNEVGYILAVYDSHVSCEYVREQAKEIAVIDDCNMYVHTIANVVRPCIGQNISMKGAVAA